MHTVFSLSSFLALPLWALMIVVPRWRWTHRIMASPLSVVAPAVLYALLVLPNIASVLPAVVNPTLAGIRALLGTEAGTTIAWVHFLAFDLFVGRWAYLDSRAHQINALLMVPILFFTLMLGPIGLLLYLAARALVPNTGTPHGATVQAAV